MLHILISEKKKNKRKKKRNPKNFDEEKRRGGWGGGLPGVGIGGREGRLWRNEGPISPLERRRRGGCLPRDFRFGLLFLQNPRQGFSPHLSFLLHSRFVFNLSIWFEENKMHKWPTQAFGTFLLFGFNGPLLQG